MNSVATLMTSHPHYQAHINGNALGAMLKQDSSLFMSLVKQSLVQCVIQAALAPSLRYMSRALAQQWRERLSDHMFGLYFKAKAYYKVNSVYGAPPHPPPLTSLSNQLNPTARCSLLSSNQHPLATNQSQRIQQGILILGICTLCARHLTPPPPPRARTHASCMMMMSPGTMRLMIRTNGW
jgi:hypothetical protein